MTRSRRTGGVRPYLVALALLATAGAGTVLVGAGSDPPVAPPESDPILRGRALVLEHACSGCHGGTLDPADERWMIGMNSPEQEFLIGPCAFEPGAQPCFRTRPRNLTPDNRTGMGRFSERQIFNSLRFGLRPGETPDVEITSTTPGVGNFPEHPKYLAPPMPWTAWRHMPDEDLWAIAAYLKRAVKLASNFVADSEGPPDFWASEYIPENMGTYPAPPFPTAREIEPPAALREQVLRGRQVTIQHDCGACHGGWTNPEREGWLAGAQGPQAVIPFGACLVNPEATPCFLTRPANLTPDAETGIGRYTDQQLFNALRFGLQPAFAPDAELGAGSAQVAAAAGAHLPADARFMAPTMPWAAWRHMSDADLRALIVYLRHGVRAVSNAVEPSDAPPDFWASESTPDKVGPYPPPPFPAAREIDPAR